jgi:2-haloacid dehalogenase
MAALPLIVFDVNETLLDLETMEPTFERIFGEKSAMRLWFADLILYSAALTMAGCYVPFTDIGSAVMKMLADTRRIKIEDNDKKELTERFSTMPPHPEVRPRCANCAMQVSGSSLSPTTCLKFKPASLNMAALSICLNGDSVQTASSTISLHAKLTLMSRKRSALNPPACLIACHRWDTLGAVAAGWEAALIKRVGNDVLGVGPQPQIVGNDLDDVSNRLIARYMGRAGAS